MLDGKEYVIAQGVSAFGGLLRKFPGRPRIGLFKEFEGGDGHMVVFLSFRDGRFPLRTRTLIMAYIRTD